MSIGDYEWFMKVGVGVGWGYCTVWQEKYGPQSLVLAFMR